MNSKYKVGQVVKIDRGGSGDGMVFGTIKEIKPKKVGCNDSYEYSYSDLTGKDGEYYVRKATRAELKFKKLAEKLNIKEFDIDDKQIKREFWSKQMPNIKKARTFINDFLYPYLKETGKVISLDDMTNWDINYRKALPTKNDYFFVIPHDELNFVVQKNSTYVTLFITFDNYYGNKKCGFSIFNYAVEHSDEEYTELLKKTTQEIITEFEKGLKNNGVYYIHVDYKTTDKLSLFRNPLHLYSYNIDDSELPGYEYTRALFDLSVVKHSLFSWN